ncbi:hypothetical protein ACQY0O_005620 [Thecaphora frezii]
MQSLLSSSPLESGSSSRIPSAESYSGVTNRGTWLSDLRRKKDGVVKHIHKLLKPQINDRFMELCLKQMTSLAQEELYISDKINKMRRLYVANPHPNSAILNQFLPQFLEKDEHAFERSSKYFESLENAYRAPVKERYDEVKALGMPPKQEIVLYHEQVKAEKTLFDNWQKGKGITAVLGVLGHIKALANNHPGDIKSALEYREDAKTILSKHIERGRHLDETPLQDTRFAKLGHDLEAEIQVLKEMRDALNRLSQHSSLPSPGVGAEGSVVIGYDEENVTVERLIAEREFFLVELRWRFDYLRKKFGLGQ